MHANKYVTVPLLVSGWAWEEAAGGCLLERGMSRGEEAKKSPSPLKGPTSFRFGTRFDLKHFILMPFSLRRFFRGSTLT